MDKMEMEVDTPHVSTISQAVSSSSMLASSSSSSTSSPPSSCCFVALKRSRQCGPSSSIPAPPPNKRQMIRHTKFAESPRDNTEQDQVNENEENRQIDRDRIAALPEAIIQWMTNTFCDDASAVAFTYTSQSTFRLLKNSYRVRGEVEFVWKEEEDEKEMKSQQRDLNQEKNEKENDEAAASSATTSDDASSDSSGTLVSTSQQQDSLIFHAENVSTAYSACPPRLAISVAFPCLVSMAMTDSANLQKKDHLDPRSYTIPTYSIQTAADREVNSSPGLRHDPFARSPYRIGIPHSIYIGTPKTDELCQPIDESRKATEITKVLLSSLPVTITSLRIEYCGMSALPLLQRLSRLGTFIFDRVRSLECLNEIARLIPHLRVLRLDSRYQWERPQPLTANKNNGVFLLPSHLEELYLGCAFQDLENHLVIHGNLRVLHYDLHEQPLREWKLPSSLTELRVGTSFNNVDDWTPPASLRTLIFGHSFSPDLSKIVWPQGLTRLVLDYFSQISLKDITLPESLIHLNVTSDPPGRNYSLATQLFSAAEADSRPNIPFFQPPRLESLTISTVSHTLHSILLDLPDTLRTLQLDSDIILHTTNLKWPHSITNLELDVRHFDMIQHFTLPPRLHILQLKGGGERESPPIKMFSVPSTLSSLTLPQDAECSIELLQSLLQSCHFSLQTLKLGYCSQQSMADIELPPHLTHLELPHKWNRPVSELPHFPPSLRFLKFDEDWNQLLTGLRLPASLRRLHFGVMCDQDLTSLNMILPRGLRGLILSGYGEVLFSSLPHLKVPQYCSLFANVHPRVPSPVLLSRAIS